MLTLQGYDRILEEAAGVNMHTWRIGRTVVGHLEIAPWAPWKEAMTTKVSEGKNERIGEKVFFMRGRIMAGQADLKNNKFGFKDWRWLSKDEIEATASSWYWSKVKNMLAAR
jgi:large subunit ribosomal protein L46